MLSETRERGLGKAGAKVENKLMMEIYEFHTGARETEVEDEGKAFGLTGVVLDEWCL